MGDYKVRASDQMSVERSVFTAVKLYADDDEKDGRPAKRDAASEQRRKVDAEPSIIITSGLFKNKRTYYTYCVVGILVLLHCVVLISILFPYPLHASCIVKWKFSEPCTHVTQKLRYQIMNWSSWNTCRQRDHNCLYTLKSSTEENVIRATHTTSNLKSHEKIRIVFEEMNNTCLATADSITNDWFTVFDYGANYCNLHNLVVGAGLDTKFLETTSDAICTQFSMAVCE